MKFTKLDLLTLLISLFLFASCNKSNTIGLDLDPANAIQGNLVDTVTVGSKTVTDDPVRTFGSSISQSRYPLGSITDNIFGTTNANLVLGVNLPNAAYSFGTNPTIDSAVLVLTYSAPGAASTVVTNTTFFYGDTTSSNYNVEVHQLQNNLYLESSFLSNKQWAFNPTVLGSYSGKIKPTTPFKITDIVTGKADTLKSVLPQIRIKLNNAFVQSNIANLSPGSLLNNPSFYAAFKGLYVTGKTTGTGGIMMINAADSRIEVYYKRQNATTTTAIDTVAVNFPITPATGPVAATVTNQWSTAINNQLSDTQNTQFDVTYLQPMGGLRTKVNFPYLSAFTKAVGGRVVINKAELVINLSSGTDSSPFTPSQRLALYRYDIAGQRSFLADDNPPTQTGGGDPRAVTNFGGFYDSTNKQYKFIVTSYLQDLLDGKTVDYGTYLSASAYSSFDFTSSINSAARSVIGSSKNTTNKIKLNIYYTKIN